MTHRRPIYIPLLLICGMMLFCSKEKSPTQPTATTQQDAIARQTHQLINSYRRTQGLPPLTLNETISKQARAHSQNMATRKVPFSHDGFQARLDVISKSIASQSAAENVAYNQGYSNPAEIAVEGWLKSPGHKANIDGNFNLTGIGVAVNDAGEYYLTQIFVLSR